MTPERWERLQGICFAAIELPAGEREGYLNRVCADDPALRDEAERLLRHHDAAPEFLEDPVVAPEMIAESGDAPADASFIGPYRIIRPLGEGGMGTVYLAVHEKPDLRQSVAVKVIRPGMNSGEILQRFRLERQILASLDHPNVARILDAGSTDDGRPYFVMEYIEGAPIDRYCEEHQLSLDDRLVLFDQICAAVQHAHQNLVVHRDLKPSNVLVTTDGAPKLLDFGIGKLLAPTGDLTTPQTRTDVRMFTPEYAAPEQVRGEAVTTATDVYSLGVVLYRLLTDRHPYLEGGESLAEIERAVCEVEPERASQAAARPGSQAAGQQGILGAEGSGARRKFQRQLVGDLDTIVLKALRKEPARRYPSAAALGRDIQRHREGLPITARADTFTYRFGKFVRRHAVGVTAAAVVLVSLLGILVVTLIQSSRVAEERDNALRERDKAVEVRGFLMEMFGATGADAAADTLTARQLLDLQAAAIETTYDDRPELKAEMMEVLADGYDRLGLMQRAEPMAQAALDLRRSILPPDHPDLAASLNMVGWINHRNGRSREAVPLLEEAISIRRGAGTPHRTDVSRSLNDLGVVLQALAERPRAESLFVEALAIRERELGVDHRSFGITANNLATVRFQLGDYEGAAAIGARALASLERSVGPDHQRTIIAESNLAIFRGTAGDYDGAEQTHRSLVDRQTRVQGRRHPQTAWAIHNLAGHIEAERPTEARGLLLEAISIDEEAGGLNHPVLATRLVTLARVELSLGNIQGSLSAYDRAERLMRTSYGDEYPNLYAIHLGRARVQEAMGDLVAAIRSADHAERLMTTIRGPNDRLTLRARNRRGQYMLAAGDAEGALAYHLGTIERADPETADREDQIALVGSARARLALGRLDEAAEDIARLRDLRDAGTLLTTLVDSLDALERSSTANR